MRTLVLLGAVFVLALGAAFAQDASQDHPGRWHPKVDENRRFVARDFPDQPWSQGIEGSVVACCVPRANRSLDCRGGFEAPLHHHFLEGALSNISRQRISEASLQEYLARPPEWIDIYYGFVIVSPSAESRAREADFRARAPAMCASLGSPPVDVQQTPQPDHAPWFEPVFEPYRWSYYLDQLPAHRALAVDHIAGAGVVCCHPNADRSLSCRAVWDAPENQHFGASAKQSVESEVHLSAASYADYLAHFAGRDFPQYRTFETRESSSPDVPSRAEREAMCVAN